MACCYHGCTNTRKKNPNLTFFRFPKEKERRYLWMKKCNNSSIQNLSFEELQNRVVCEDHFLPKCFDYSVLTSGRTRRSLFKFALPQPAADIAALKRDDESARTSTLVLISPENDSQAKQKDLASPERLMNITENLCPLMRPISPAFSDSDDSHIPLIPEVTMATSFSDIETDEDEYPRRSPMPKSIPYILELGVPPLSTTIIMSPTTTTTTAATNIGAMKNIPSIDKISCMGSSKRSHEPVTPFQDVINHESSIRKYKKILPKNEETGTEAKVVLHSVEQNLSYGEHPGKVVLNLSGLSINKLEKTPKGTPTAKTTSLYLDNNLLQTLPTIDSYTKLTKLSLVNNKIDSLIWFGRLTSLRVLNLSKNKITDIDGLWKLWHLTHVNLSENSIQTLRGQLNDPRSNLEHLNVSQNHIKVIGDLSMLTDLKELLLHQNQITTLSKCRRNLPKTLIKLTLAKNVIQSLGDISELSNLENLKELSMKHNICNNVLQLVDFQGNPVGLPRSFDYRPYVFTWCPTLTYLDSKEILSDERMKAHWLLSEGKLGDIPVEKHASLVTYLSEVCPLPVFGHEHVSHTQEPSHEQQIQPQSNQNEIQFDPKLVKIMPLNNNVTAARNLSHQGTPNSILKRALHIYRQSVENKESEGDCSETVPCKHYIELIEERAKNYKLMRKNEALTGENESLLQRIQMLETTLTQNGLNINDLFVKIEVEEETEEHEMSLFPQ